MTSPSSISNILRTARKARNLTQEALAAEVGLSRSHLGMIERGHDLPGREMLVALFTFLELPLGLIAGDSSQPGDPSPSVSATNEEEALWLHGYRSMAEEERKTLLKYVLERVKPSSN